MGIGVKGRPKGSRSVKTTRIAENYARDGEILPLEVMIEAMRTHYNRWVENKTKAIESGAVADVSELATAAKYAVDAAPYLHAKLTSIEATVTDERAPIGWEPLNNEEWQLVHGRNRIHAPGNGRLLEPPAGTTESSH